LITRRKIVVVIVWRRWAVKSFLHCGA
jgi:hypothetical protein